MIRAKTRRDLLGIYAYIYLTRLYYASYNFCTKIGSIQRIPIKDGLMTTIFTHTKHTECIELAFVCANYVHEIVIYFFDT